MEVRGVEGCEIEKSRKLRSYCRCRDSWVGVTIGLQSDVQRVMYRARSKPEYMEVIDLSKHFDTARLRFEIPAITVDVVVHSAMTSFDTNRARKQSPISFHHHVTFEEGQHCSFLPPFTCSTCLRLFNEKGLSSPFPSSTLQSSFVSTILVLSCHRLRS